ncbi:uncharacterized protein [Venturia canescens]|uniref:uncharacterized protein n=1 Tax=Venturia canescens TaxID=32260 RepID=UPI001C9BE2E3|nr:uncharacterized protein LOC122411609 [Venturia canescens]
MASRSSACPRQPGRGSIARPAMTRTQMLRAAQTSAVVQRRPPRESCPEPPPRPSFARQALSKPCPKKIDFAKPGMTKAMQMRQRVAAEKIKGYEEQQRTKEAACRRTRRSAPASACPRPRSAAQPSRRTNPESLKLLQTSIDRGHEASMQQPCNLAVEAAIEKGHVATGRGAVPKRRRAGPSGCPRPVASGTPFPEDTRELAKSMNADVVQAMPLSDGPVNKIIIDPGAVRSDRSTIVVLPTEGGACGSDAANKSIQAITESLDEQDAAESAAVQSKLEDLQNARREFVITVANVSGNAANVADESGDSILNSDEMEPMEYMPMPQLPTRERTIVRVPDISHVMFQIEYGKNHPQVEAARRFSRKTQITLDNIAQQKRMEDVFERAQREQIQDFDLNVPLEQDIQEGDISWEEDEYGTLMACPSRIKASMRVPRRSADAPPVCGANVEEIERFFDLAGNPPEPSPPGAPPGRENLNPDLWDIEDPWYFEQSYDPPPLINFDSPC